MKNNRPNARLHNRDPQFVLHAAIIHKVQEIINNDQLTIRSLQEMGQSSK